MKQRIFYGVVFSSIIAMGPLSFAADHDEEVANSKSVTQSKQKAYFQTPLLFG
jgi:hypothetical protein